ncbi:MAG: LysR family transcriptional regulator, partial [Polaromonas sp.]|nr:LysR family transcriptional regulator [Polaromonas sp.]
LEVTTEDRPVDMVEEGYDLVIRVNPDPDESLVGRIFLRDQIVMVAHPGLQRPAGGTTPVPVVLRGGGVDGQTAVWELTDKGKRKRLTVQPVLSLSSLFMVRDAVRANVGAARLPLSLVIPDLAAGTLVQWGDAGGPEVALWALYPSRRLLSARVSAFLNFLKQAFPEGSPGELAAYIR